MKNNKMICFDSSKIDSSYNASILESKYSVKIIKDSEKDHVEMKEEYIDNDTDNNNWYTFDKMEDIKFIIPFNETDNKPFKIQIYVQPKNIESLIFLKQFNLL